MIVAAVIRNVAEGTKLFGIYQKESEVLGGMCLNIFLSCALMSLKLWQLADLAVPLIVTLLIQTVVMALFAYFVISVSWAETTKPLSWLPAPVDSVWVPRQTPSPT